MIGTIWLVRTPLREVGGMTYGGPMRLKLGRRRVAYAGFASAALAEEACRHWSITVDHDVEPWAEALRHEAPGARVRAVVLFTDEDDFRAYLEDPAGFDADAHVIDLHPGALAPRAEVFA